MSDNKTIEHLLEQVSTISKKYKDIAKITGENFNIFHILNMASDEVGLHSRLIGELLNPKGSHDQGAMFLQIFLEECGLLEFVEGEELNLTKVVIEESIGRIGENHEEGGRIDLVLKFDNGKFIVIENKIYAVDQPKQLLRYKKAYPTAKIVYLNLGGKDEITKEISGLKVEEFIWISYKTEILNWLQKSAKEAYGLPNIQYILDHYIKIINYLTNQNSNNKMKEEILEFILSSEEKLNSFFSLTKTQNDIYIEIISKNLKSQIQEIALNLGLTADTDDLGRHQYSCFRFSNELLNANNLKITFSFESANNRNLWFGITQFKGQEIIINRVLLESEFLKIFGKMDIKTDYALVAKYWSDNENRDWSNENFTKVYNGIFKTELEQKVKELLLVVDYLNKK